MAVQAMQRKDNAMCRRILIVESDQALAERLVAAMVSVRQSAEPFVCAVVHSLREFHERDPASWDLVISASHLPDGSGFDILAYAQGLRPDAPVILTGTPEDSAAAVEAIRAGAADYLVLTGHETVTLPATVQKCRALQQVRNENDRLHADLSHSLSELAVANRELQLMIQRLEVAARTDDLTKLANRRWVNLMLDGRWEEANRSGLPLAFLMIDLDGFKSLNDRLGHHRGDEVLRIAARVLEANSRSIDVAGRFGGDEFCVLMPHADPDAAVRVANRIAAAFDEAVAALDLPMDVSMSIGVAHWQVSSPVNADALVRHADEAMYEAKTRSGRHVILRQPRCQTAA